jgi:hypothetical protein
MARGNQRDKAREANQKKMADQVCVEFFPLFPSLISYRKDNALTAPPFTEERQLYDGKRDAA